MAKVTVTPAQKTALEYLWVNGAKEFNRFHGRREEIPFDKLRDKELAIERRTKDGMREYVLTEAGRELATSLFGNNDPDNTPAAPDDDSEPTAQDALLATEPVLVDSWLSPEDNEAFAELSEPLPQVADAPVYALFVEKDGKWSQYDNETTDLQRLVNHTEKPNGMITRKGLQWKIVRAENLTIGLSPDAPVVAENAPAEDVAVDPYPTGSIVTVCGVQHEVQPNGVFKQLPPVAPQPVSRVQWVTHDDLPMPVFENALQRATFRRWILGYNARQSAPMPRRRDLRGSQVVRQANMQKRLKSKPATQKREPLHETVLKVVSRIQTPLTSDVRRIA